MVKRIISVFGVLVILFSSCLSVYADIVDSGSYIASNFWDFLSGNEFDYNLDFWNNVTGYFVGKECPSSPDSYHHGPKPAFGSSSGGSDENGRFSWATCEYCGNQFKVYSSFSGGSGFGKSDLQQSYESQVEELPALGYSSDGGLLIPTEITSHKFNRASSWPQDPSVCNNHTLSSDPIGASEVRFSCSLNKVVAVLRSGYSSIPYGIVIFEGKLIAPYDGFYQRIETPSYSGHLAFVDGTSKNISSSYSVGNSVYYSAGSTVFSGNLFVSSSGKDLFSYELIGYPAYYKFTPAPTVDINFDTTYNINSRPTSITGDYGIIGDNGQITKVEGNTIVNETNNTYYNPATGETDTITDWSYNYEDRSYTLTLGGGTTTTVTYGDENVTIKEGDTTYNVYYLVNGSGSENPDPGPDVPTDCDHTWTETSRTEPTCSTPGKVTSTCSKCNQTKTETIPAVGHSWVVDRTVQTEYDEEGNLLQQGYTIYSCSVCGEQYKDMEGTGPPGPSDGDNSGDGGLIEFLDGLIKSLSKNLHGAVELILSFFQEVPAMFSGFLAFLTAMFPFLPPEIMTLFTFGIAAVVFIGIIKAIRR